MILISVIILIYTNIWPLSQLRLTWTFSPFVSFHCQLFMDRMPRTSIPQATMRPLMEFVNFASRPRVERFTTGKNKLFSQIGQRSAIAGECVILAGFLLKIMRILCLCAAYFSTAKRKKSLLISLWYNTDTGGHPEELPDVHGCQGSAEAQQRTRKHKDSRAKNPRSCRKRKRQEGNESVFC